MHDFFPDAGMVGNYGEARILVRNVTFGYTTGIQNGNDMSVFEEEMPTVNGTEGVAIFIVTAWSTRFLSVQVVSVETGTPSGTDFR